MDRVQAEFRDISDKETQRANRADWDREADDYQAEHGSFLRDDGFVWSPEGVDEASVGLLGDVRGRRILELGCGAAQCSRWLASQGAEVVGLDLSERQLQHSRRIDQGGHVQVPVVCASATALPFPDGGFDLACSAFGALSFLVDIAAGLREVHRVLAPGGRCVFSVVHPVRWMFADDPGAGGTTVVRSYFDRRAYVELDDDARPSYVEPHHTLADWVRAMTAARLRIDDLLEPEWPPGHDREWGGWGPVRGALVPGTAIFTVSRPAAA